MASGFILTDVPTYGLSCACAWTNCATHHAAICDSGHDRMRRAVEDRGCHLRQCFSTFV